MLPSQPLLLLVDDQPANLDVLVSHLEGAGMDLAVSLNGADALSLAQRRQPDLILLDVMMPDLDGFAVCRKLKEHAKTRDIPVIFMSALDDTDSKVKGFSCGAVDYVTKPLQREEVLARVHAHLTLRRQQQELEIKNLALKEQIAQRKKAENALIRSDQKLQALSRQEAARWKIDAFIGSSEATRCVINEIRNLQQVDKTPVLILGESGTGKELVARAIHYGSGRSGKPFITVNCAAIPSELADAELFGHTKGAFTGATQDRVGVFEQADGGTLFLDEIGDMPFTLQSKLLRVLENGEVTPVGSNRTRKVNVRVVSATNNALQHRMQNQEFRQDLYYRLAGYTLQLAPLRHRKDDIPALAAHFLGELSQQMARENCQLSNDALLTMQEYDYPGNIRELRNMIEHALISSRGGTIQPQHFHTLALANDSTPLAPSSTLNAAPHADNPEKVIIDYLSTHRRINNTETQNLLSVSHSRASYLLKKLLRDGLLEKQGERRWAYYQLSES
jgi:DNA-binding NtrC family response regulator